MSGLWRFVVLVLLLSPDAGAQLSPVAFPVERPMRVAFLDALEEGNPWRDNLVGTMRAAARDLGIDFTVHPVGHWPGEILERAREVMTGPGRPDYLLVTMHRGSGTGMLELSRRTGVPVFVINSGLLPGEAARFGGPRGHFPLWLGQMVPDEEHAGRTLARLLLEAATGSDTPRAPVRLVALEGQLEDSSGLRRSAGLRQAVAGWTGAELLQAVSASWDAEVARRKAELLLRRYPRLQVLWAANDTMALGALRAVEAAGLRPGEDVRLGGMDWTPEALQAVRDGRLVTTLGGHFLEGAWALVLLYDHHHGRDFASEGLEWRTSMAPVTRAHVDSLLQVLGEGDCEAIDFRAFSKVANPSLKHYDFSLRALFAQRHLRFPGPLLESYGFTRPLPPGSHP
ncbi:monosaccharide ABC transporter substrate-binding protein (CUT2 family) [Archangium gephyra]|uniref:Monosaccharide ABC transporter substrate-binding protein (CUT2 family) n=1 Tax=Archangium gephyra TaxID=48 RepID=A0AAC8TAN1_9BACT|nr:ABC transporter substrate-binding protein [Archangium gephyra]AKI98797.1 Periplasmic sugar-binding domain protein [Archangium gephyra]REG30717.1 monosaccharide ABC transporter substrate-binding protein (CUT2 family) [Archangium gephyra]